jgi:hypothetical protein
MVAEPVNNGLHQPNYSYMIALHVDQYQWNLGFRIIKILDALWNSSIHVQTCRLWQNDIVPTIYRDHAK